MKGRLWTYLQLARFPNWFTAMADVVAGYLIASLPHVSGGTLAALIGSTSAIYAGGCVFNDYFDRAIDAGERPSRPIPSGRVSPTEALLLGVLVLAAGLGFAACAGVRSFLVAGVLVALVLFYDGRMKQKGLFGPTTMAACRGANLMLGMSPAFSLTEIWSIFPLFSFVYVFALTVLSTSEVAGGSQKRGWMIWGGWLTVVLGMIGLAWKGAVGLSSLAFLGLLVIFSGPPLFRGLRRADPESIQNAVKYLVLGIPILDAAYVSGIQGPAYGILVLVFLLPPLILARFFYVT